MSAVHGGRQERHGRTNISSVRQRSRNLCGLLIGLLHFPLSLLRHYSLFHAEMCALERLCFLICSSFSHLKVLNLPGYSELYIHAHTQDTARTSHWVNTGSSAFDPKHLLCPVPSADLHPGGPDTT